jgi:quercetin dioxygenase-like cupin family protein
MRLRLMVAVVSITGLAYTANAKPKEAVVMAADELKWVDVPEAKGVQMAMVKGDPMKGAYQGFVKFPAGTMHPLHTHTNDVMVIVISGVMTYGPEGGTEKKLPAGSFLWLPGKLKHTSGCDASGPCMMYQSGTAKFDFKPVAPPAAAAAPKEK